MKNCICLMLVLAAVCVLRGEDDSGYVPESRSSSEVFTSKVLKVLSFQDDDCEYLAYVIKWRGHEVVVTPYAGPSGDKRYDVGDSIRCQMTQTVRRANDTAKARINFSVINGSAFLATASEDLQRLDAVKAEIERRRQLRSSVPAPAAGTE